MCRGTVLDGRECSVNETDQTPDLVGCPVKLPYKMYKFCVLFNLISFWRVRI